MNFKSIIAAAISTTILLAPTVARAEWVQIADSVEGTLVFVDNDSVAQDGELVTFKQKLDGNRGKVTGVVVANCYSGQFQWQTMQHRGKVIHPKGASFPVEKARLGSIDASAIQYACSVH